jgi:hypothetical protein
MKNLIKVFSLALVAGSFLTSCEGPMGPSGANGLDGLDGKDANESCVICHNTVNMDAKEAEFEFSDKGARGARSGKYCARCHSTEGFKEITKMGSFTPTNEWLNGTRIGCDACHKHSAFDFGVDTISQILRTVEPVYLNWDNYNFQTNNYVRTVATDFHNTNNLCANCHQFRGATVNTYTDTTKVPKITTPVKYNTLLFPIVNTGGNENTTVQFRSGYSFSIHEGAQQPDFLTSQHGYEYTGKTYTRNTAHSGYTCTQCHFNEYDATDNTGGHTMIVNKKDPKCVTCHNIDSRRVITLAAVNAKLVELGDLLAARKVFKKSTSGSYSPVPTHDFYGTLLPNTASATQYALSLSTSNTVSATTGLLVYNSMVKWGTDPASTGTAIGWGDRANREWKYGELGAAYNYTYVNSVADANNKAVHNPTYAIELLQTSIDWLKANPAK